MKVSKNAKTALTVGLVVAGMVGMSFAAVPLYRIFCQVTGFGGTTQRAEFASDIVLDRKITVRFDSSTAPGLPWKFKPGQISEEINIGQSALAYYTAENLSDELIIGTATYNVVPNKAGLYFRKIECFCFTEQVLEPGEKAELPMTFFIDPDIVNDRNLDDVTTITISYSFARNEAAEAEYYAALDAGVMSDRPKPEAQGGN